MLNSKQTNSEGQHLTKIDDIFRNYKEKHNGIENVLDMDVFNTVVEIVRKTSIDSDILDGVIRNGYADKLKIFADKADLEKYSKELSLIFGQLTNYTNHKRYSEILNENISERDLNYLLDLQKLIYEHSAKDEEPQILDNNWFKNFTGDKEIDAIALNKLRYYIEMDLANPNTEYKYIYINDYIDNILLYQNSPENIDRIESLMYDKGLNSIYQHLLNNLSSQNPKVLNKQLDLIESILDYTGDLSGNKSYLQSNLIGIIRDAKTLEDVNTKIKELEQQIVRIVEG